MTCPAGCTRLLKGVTAIEQLRSENAPKAAADSFRMTAHATQVRPDAAGARNGRRDPGRARDGRRGLGGCEKALWPG